MTQKGFYIFVKDVTNYIQEHILYVIYYFKLDFTKSIFHTLNKGIYFLRLEVDW